MREGEVMKLFKKSFSALLLACSMAAILGSSVGCNTVHGVGQESSVEAKKLRMPPIP